MIFVFCFVSLASPFSLSYRSLFFCDFSRLPAALAFSRDPWLLFCENRLLFWSVALTRWPRFFIAIPIVFFDVLFVFFE